MWLVRTKIHPSLKRGEKEISSKLLCCCPYALRPGPFPLGGREEIHDGLMFGMKRFCFGGRERLNYGMDHIMIESGISNPVDSGTEGSVLK